MMLAGQPLNLMEDVAEELAAGLDQERVRTSEWHESALWSSATTTGRHRAAPGNVGSVPGFFGQWLASLMESTHPLRRSTMAATVVGSNDVAKALIEGTLAAFRANKGWADKAVAQLPDDKLHVALDPETNCIAVIMKHLAGNLLSRWTDFLASDGEKPWRNRDDEFVDTFASKEELLAYWESGWQRLFEALASLSAADVGKTVLIRGEPHSVPLAIQRSLAHCGYHVGQIVLIARILAGSHWTTITIPRGGSAGFNQQVWGKAGYQAPDSGAR
ncbi:DUF1572 family protein [Singulisphaera rosea]